MTVFKAYMKIAKKNIWLFVMYLIIFFAVTSIFQKVKGSAEEESKSGYRTESIPIGIVDEDKGKLAESLKDYLGRTNEILSLENDKEVLQENLFYRNVEYILWIPQEFEKTCITGNENLRVVKVPDSSAGYYIDQQINSFLNYAKVYKAAGFTEEETAEKMNEVDKANVTLADLSGNDGKTPEHVFYYQYMPYLILSVICYMLGYIFLGFRKGELPRRMQASAIPKRRQSAEGLLAAGILSLVLWGIVTIAGIVLYGQPFIRSEGFAWFLVNSLALVTVALALAYLCGMCIKNSTSLSGLVNVLTLGMCFLCGAFVPLEYLNKGVKTAAQFFPVYWYEKVNGILGEFGTIAGSVRTEVLQGIGIQLVFAAALVCVTFAVSREKH